MHADGWPIHDPGRVLDWVQPCASVRTVEGHRWAVDGYGRAQARVVGGGRGWPEADASADASEGVVMSRIEFRCLTISANDGKREMSQLDGRYRRRYIIKVVSDATGATREFHYTDSIHNEESGKVGLAGDDLLFAFRAFVEDGIAGDQPFREFCADLGYDTDSINARNTWKACVNASAKFVSLWASRVDPADVLDELAALGIE